MAALGQYLIGQQMQEEEEENPLLDPLQVGPGTVNPQNMGPQPIGMNQQDAPPGPTNVTGMLGEAGAPQDVRLSAAAEKVAEGETTSASTSFSDWLDKNRTKSQSEWAKEKWKKAGKLGKLAMILDSAAQGMSGFTQAYLPSKGVNPGRPYESPLRQQYEDYTKSNEALIKTRASSMREQNRELETLRKAGKNQADIKTGNIKNTLAYYKLVSTGMIADQESRMDAAKFASARQDANTKISMFNEEERRRWAEFYGDMTPNRLEEALTQSLYQQFGNDPARLAAEVEAHMRMIEEMRAKNRAIGRRQGAPGTGYTSMQDTRWYLKEGKIHRAKGVAFIPKPGAAGKSVFRTDTGDLSPASVDFFFHNEQQAKEVVDFVKTVRQINYGMQSAAKAVNENQRVTGLWNLSPIKTLRQLGMIDSTMGSALQSDLPPDEQFNVGAGVSAEEVALLVSLKNAALMHSRGQIGYRPSQQLVDALEKEIGQGEVANPVTRLRALSAFRVLTEYSAAQVVAPTQMTEDMMNKINRAIDRWVAKVRLEKGGYGELPSLQDIIPEWDTKLDIFGTPLPEAAPIGAE